MREEIIIEEQGLRDGLQSEGRVLTTTDKLQLLDALLDAGLRRVQLCSFVHPRRVPQMADAEALFKRLERRPGITYSALVLNLRGVERAAAVGVEHLAISLSASDTHSRKNSGKGLAEAREAFRAQIAAARGAQIKIRAGIQCAFGCREEGAISEARILDLVRHHLDLGVDELALADSSGMAHPRQLAALLPRLLEEAQGVPLFLHLHDTEGKAMVNAMTALECGVRHFDAGLGGSGGCPYIPGASGNLATEDLAHFAAQFGYESGLSLHSLVPAVERLEAMLGRNLPGKISKLIQRPKLQILGLREEAPSA